MQEMRFKETHDQQAQISMAIIKAVITYSDAVEAVFEGNSVDLTQIPELSPNQLYVQAEAPTADTTITAEAPTDGAQTTETTEVAGAAAKKPKRAK